MLQRCEAYREFVLPIDADMTASVSEIYSS